MPVWGIPFIMCMKIRISMYFSKKSDRIEASKF